MKGAFLDNSALVRGAILGQVNTASSAPATGATGLGYAGDTALTSPNLSDGSVWATVYGSFGDTVDDGNAARMGSGSGGIVLGADAGLEGLRLGAFGHAGVTRVVVDDRASQGVSADFGLGVYGGAQLGSTGFVLGAAYSRHAISTTRDVAFPGLVDTLTANYGAATGQVFGEINHEFDLGASSFVPFAQLAYVRHATDEFTEKGGPAALSSAASVIEGTFASLGLRATQEFVVGDGTLGRLRGGLAWRHAFADLPVATNSFAGSSGFTVSGSPIARDSLVLEAGLDFNLAGGMNLGVSYDGLFAPSSQAHALKATISSPF